MSEVDAIVSRIECIRNEAAFSRVAARARQLTMLIVAVKIDRSPVGAKAALVHADSEAGEDKHLATDGTNSEVLAEAPTTSAATMASG